MCPLCPQYVQLTPSWQSSLDLKRLKSVLMTPQPLRILVCSGSDATLAFLNTMFSGFLVTLVASIQSAEVQLHAYKNSLTSLDFIILDDQSESHVDDLVRFLHSLNSPALRETKLIHLYTPTTSRAGQTVFGRSATPGVVKMTKPPRKSRMLQTLAGLKNLPNTISSSQTTDIARAVEDLAAAQRTLYGNVLVAEGQYPVLLTWARLTSVTTDNPIAQNLIVKQLERYQLNVTTTGNGEEALAGLWIFV